MRKMFQLLFVIGLVLRCSFSSALNITIVESQSFLTGHNMDQVWSNVASSMGHTPVIVLQTALDNNSFFASTDILIVSSGVITLPANRVSTILQFLQTGKPVYIQSEYQMSFTTNQAFAYIVGQLGGTFNWTTSVSGDLAPVNVLGTYATTNTIVAPLSYYWYSVAGQGDCNTVNFLEQGNLFHGFHYIPSNSAWGSISTTTDQDWVITNTSIPLMKNIITHLITPDQLLNAPGASLGNDTAICQGETITLNAAGGTSYLWSTGSTASSITVSTTGNFWVKVSNGQCINKDSILITVNQYPVENLGSDTTICSGNSFALNAGPAESYLWSDASTASILNVNNAGTYWVQANNGPCYSRDTILILTDQYPVADFDDEMTLCKNEKLILSGGNATYYLWSDGSLSPFITVSLPGEYWLEASNGPCKILDSVLVSLSDCNGILTLPNVFTPDNNGENDFFVPVTYSGIASASIRIFNRWGEELFHSDDLLSGWNGYYKNRRCSEGVYYWLVKYTSVTNESKEIQGFITLLK